MTDTSNAPELLPFTFIALVETPGKIGYRSLVVSATNDDEAIGVGMRQLAEIYPDHTISAPAILGITAAKIDEVKAKLPISPAQAAKVLLEDEELMTQLSQRVSRNIGSMGGHYSALRLGMRAIAEQDKTPRHNGGLTNDRLHPHDG